MPSPAKSNTAAAGDVVLNACIDPVHHPGFLPRLWLRLGRHLAAQSSVVQLLPSTAQARGLCQTRAVPGRYGQPASAQQPLAGCVQSILLGFQVSPRIIVTQLSVLALQLLDLLC